MFILTKGRSDFLSIEVICFGYPLVESPYHTDRNSDLRLVNELLVVVMVVSIKTEHTLNRLKVVFEEISVGFVH